MTKKGVSSDTDIFKEKPTILSVKFGEECEFVDTNEFKGCENLETINDDNVITSIRENAFAGTNLQVVNFKKATEIGGSAFEGCKSLSSVNIPTVESIGNSAFKNCTELKTAIIDNTQLNTPTPFEIGDSDSDSINLKTKTIGDDAFAGCVNLKQINLDNCGEIGRGAFSGCESLNEIYLKKCFKINMLAFENCTNVTQVTLSNGGIIGEIGSGAFSGCENLSKVYLNNIFKLNNVNAFPNNGQNPLGLMMCNITFYVSPEYYTDYTENDYWGWKKYKNYIVKNPDSNQIIYVTENNKPIDLIEGINTVTNKYFDETSDSEKKYGLLTFKDDIETLSLSSILSDDGKEKLISIECIPDSCEEIGEGAFAGCENLTNFTIPDSIKKIGEGAFAGCVNLTKFIRNSTTNVKVAYDGKAVISDHTLICVLPKDDSDTEGRIYDISKIDTSIERMGKSCFHGCKNMRRVDIPSTISSIGDNAFENCENLCEIHLTSSIPPAVGTNIFTNVRSDFKIFVPEESLENYFNNEGWSVYASNIYPKPRNNDIIYYGDTKLNNTHTSNSSSKTNGNYYIISNISNGSLSTNYFANKSSVEKVILGDNITKINNGAFKNCKGLEYIYLSDNVTQFNDECFYGCEILTRIHIPINLKTEYTYKPQGNKVSGSSSTTITKDGFGNNIFYGCKKLKEFGTYYKGCVSDDNRCYIHNNEIKFFAQGGLEDNYTIPNNITSINKYAFSGSEITSISIGKSMETIGAYAFEGCKQLEEITNWNNVKHISSSAFKGCVNLGEISLPTNLKMINNNAFENCVNMYINENIPDSVTTIGSYAFSGCTNFKYTDGDLTLGNISVINASTFYGCSSLKKVSINNNITNIDSSAFEGCTSLDKINLPNSITNIGSSAFKGCTSLTTVSGELPNLKVLSDSIFERCAELDEINLPSSLTKIGNSAFNGCTKLWMTKSSNSSISMPNSITTIGHHAFYGCDKITDISLPSSLEKIGTECFVNNLYTINPGTPVNQLADIDNSFDTNMSFKILNIHIPDELTSPPTFTNVNGMDDTSAIPFGNPNSRSVYIRIPSNLSNIYLNNSYWKKYSRIFLR